MAHDSAVEYITERNALLWRCTGTDWGIPLTTMRRDKESRRVESIIDDMRAVAEACASASHESSPSAPEFGIVANVFVIAK